VKVYPISFRYALELKAKIRQSHSALADDGQEQEDTARRVVCATQEPARVLSGMNLRCRFMSLQL
jgi:hypothetical protein